MTDHFRQGMEAYRAERDRRGDSFEGVVPIRRASAAPQATLGMDDVPLPPLEAYASEVQHDAGTAATTARAERASHFYSAATLSGKAVPPREWLVPELVPQKTVTLFGGDGGTGKSLLALQLAIATAAGGSWLGRTVQAGPVIFISAEDDEDELHRRTDDILRSADLEYHDLAGLTLRSLAGEDALLAVETQVALIQSALFEELDARAEAEGPVLIVIDTLADVFPSNENDRAKVRQFVGILRGLALKRRCAVILLAHPSLSGLNSGAGTSGSTAWNNSVRSRLYLSRVIQDGHEPEPRRGGWYRRLSGMVAGAGAAGHFAGRFNPDRLPPLQPQ